MLIHIFLIVRCVDLGFGGSWGRGRTDPVSAENRGTAADQGLQDQRTDLAATS